MNISSLELTLRRISQIESNFNNLENPEVEASDFQQILDKNMSSTNGIGELPSIQSLNGLNSNNSLPFLEVPESASKNEIDGYIDKYARENNIDKDLVSAVIKAESNFNTNAQSKVGALGLMQLMPATARSMGVEDPFNAEENIKGGTKYLKGLLDRFGGNQELAVAAYNAGAGAVNKYNGVPPYSETQNYVKKVLEYKKQFSQEGL